ncbi:MAG: DUF1629 domain-containing protein [Pseudomonadota bacterium]
MPKLLILDETHEDTVMYPTKFDGVELEPENPFRRLQMRHNIPVRRGERLDPELVVPFVLHRRKMTEDGQLQSPKPFRYVMVVQRYWGIVVSERFRDLLIRFDPDAVEFFEVELRSAKDQIPAPGRWFILNFLKLHDTIDEAKSNRAWLLEDKRGLVPRPGRADPVLIANPDIPSNLAFWCGAPLWSSGRLGSRRKGGVVRPAPLDCNSSTDTYCSDAFYQAATDAGMVICDRALEVLESPAAAPLPPAYASPADIMDRLEETGRYACGLKLQVTVFDETEGGAWAPMEKLKKINRRPCGFRHVTAIIYAARAGLSPCWRQ